MKATTGQSASDTESPMANPQPTPFVQFSKELFDAILLSHMPATHKEVVLAVIRRTYGDHGKKSAPISQALLQRITGRHRNSIQRSLSELKTEGVLKQVRAPSFGCSAVWSLNKNYEAWGRWSVAKTLVVGLPHDEGPHNKGEAHESVMSEAHESVLSEAHQDVPIEYIDTRETKHIVQRTAPDDSKFDAFWKLYPRKEGKGQARKAFKTAIQKAGVDAVLQGIERLAPILAERERQFIPLASTWLNGERWTDEIPVQKSGMEQLREKYGSS